MTAPHRPKVVCITTVDLSLRFLVFDHLKHLVETGYTVVAVSAPGPYLAEVAQAGITTIPVPMSRRITPFRDLVALWRLVRLLHREKPEIVHTHTPKANLLGQWAAFLSGCRRRISTVHGFYFTPETPALKQALFRLTEHLSALPSHVVFLINREDMETAVRLRIVRGDKVRLLEGGLGIDLRRFHAEGAPAAERARHREGLGIPADALVVGYVGRLVEEKGVLDLFAAFRQVLAREPRAFLLMVGPYDAAKPDAIRPDTAAKYGIGDRTLFTGMRLDTVDLYRAMDVFVLPSHREGLPISAMEAQAMRLPVVTTDARGCREVIVPGETGLLVPPRDPDALAEALLRLLHDKELRSRLGANAQRYAAQQFDQRAAFQAFDKAYRAVVWHLADT